MKVFSNDTAILKEWRVIGLLKGYMWKCMGSHLAGQPWKRWVDSIDDCLKNKKFEYWAKKDMYNSNVW